MLGNIGLLLLGSSGMVVAVTYYDHTIAVGSEWALRSLIKDFAPAISWILVILGWRYVSRDQNAREHRKEVCSQIDKICREIRELEIKAYEYLPTAADTPESLALALRLRSNLQWVGDAITRLLENEQMDVRDEMMELRQAITGHEFDSKSRQPCGLDSGWAAEIRAASNGMMSGLEIAFRQKYPN